MFKNLVNILEYIRNTKTHWIAQKYIELPLIIKNLKFDIRQWVVVSDLSPMTIWFFDECYIRFAAEDYDYNKVGNKYSHLTNNSVAKHSKKDDKKIEGNMWDVNQFNDYLKVPSIPNIFLITTRELVEKTCFLTRLSPT